MHGQKNGYKNAWRKEINKMEKLEDSLKKVFHEGLSNLKVDPPESVWSGIVRQQKAKTRLFYFRYAAAAALILLFIGIPIWILWQPIKNEKPEVIASKNATEIVTEKQGDNTGILQNAESEATNIFALSTGLAQISKSSVPSKTGTNPRDLKNEISQNTALPSNYNQKAAIETLNETPIIEAGQPAIAANTEQTLTEKHHIQKSEKIKITEPLLADDYSGSPAVGKKQSMQLAVAFGSNIAGSVQSDGLMFASNISKFSLDPFQSDMAYETSFFEQIDHVSAKPPVSIGLKINFPLSKRFSFETGLIYTELTTASKTASINNAHNEYVRTLYYLGVPLGIRYNIIAGKQAKLYIQQSLIVEKGIRATNRIYHFEKNIKTETKQMGAPMDGFQLSTLSTAGVDVRVLRNFSAYGETGFQVFYLNHLQPFNIRSVKNVWPVLQTGLRITI